MNQPSIYRSFVRYVSLNILSMVGLSAYILADTYFIANGVGADGLVALNLALPVYSLIHGSGLLLGLGGATRFSIALGKSRAVDDASVGADKRAVSRIFMQALYPAAILGLLFVLLGIFLTPQLARLLGADDSILPLTVSYLRTILCFSPAFIASNLAVCFVRNDGAPRLAMAGMLTASLSNILLDYLFIYPLGMGMFGAALATGIAPLLSLSIQSLHFFRGKSSFGLTRCRPDLQELSHIAGAGAPSFVSELSSGLAILLFNQVILSVSGNLGVGAYGIIANISLVCASVFTGIGQGIQPLVSLNHGAGDRNAIKKIFLCACGLAVVLGAAFTLTGLFAAPPLVALFNQEQNLELARIAQRGLKLYFTAFPAMGLNLITISLLASSARAGRSFLLSSLRGILLLVPSLLILPRLWGMDGVWLAVPIVEMVTLFCAIWCLRRSPAKKS